jgi:hypothetical protein
MTLLRVALGVVLLLAAPSCRAPAAVAPDEVVARYFRFLARDPIRTLPLLTPAFHAGHGLHVVTTAEARRWRPDAQREAVPDPEPRPFAVDRYMLAWLAVQTRAPFRATRERLGWERLDGAEAGARAWVEVRVRPAAQPPFVQRFALVREGPGHAWRIDAVEQRGVVRENRAAAFVAWPSEASRRTMERELAGAG